MDYAQKIFWIGQFGESFHRFLLESNKKQQQSGTDASSRSGVLPQSGGLFKYVAAPHLLFEIVAWIGIAGCARQANAYVQATLVAAILALQAKKLNDVDRNERESLFAHRGGEEPPPKRWNLIPYIY